MAIIYCEVSGCRYQSRRQCTLAGIQVAIGSVPTVEIPLALEGEVDSLAGHDRRGYASEFLAYAEYAESLAQEPRPGGICYSFAPL